jgi:hypothetical protein
MKGNLEEMQKLAKEHGGKCLSNVYTNRRTKLLWECKEGHQWKTAPGNIKSGNWCPYCGIKRRVEARKLGIEVMRQIAEERGGRCLSTTYINSKTKLLWECDEGHRWKATPGSVRSGKWCPYCGGTAKLTIEEMRQIAKEHRGKCLSNVYVNDRTKLLWQCEKGHQWEARPHDVKRGSWCPTCARLKKQTKT